MRESASAGVAPALKVQVQGECRLVAALKVQVQAFGHALSLSGECALALCVLWARAAGGVTGGRGVTAGDVVL